MLLDDDDDGGNNPKEGNESSVAILSSSMPTTTAPHVVNRSEDIAAKKTSFDPKIVAKKPLRAQNEKNHKTKKAQNTALLPGPSQATPMQNLDLSRTPPQIHASQNPLIPALVPTSLNPQHHSAISFVVSGAASIDYPPTFITPTPATMLYNYQDQQHDPIGKPPDLGSVKMNDNMAEDSDDSDYLGTSEEEGSGTSDDDTSVVNEREMELELEALRSLP